MDANTEDQSSSKNEIAGLKYDLKQLDNEICYFEEQNRKHGQAQSQLQKALEFEICRGKELGVNEADAKVRLQARDSELNKLEHDFGGLQNNN